MKSHTINQTTKYLMYMTALVFDGVQFIVSFIPIVGQILSILINIFAQMTFALWFYTRGISYFEAKRGVRVILTAATELIPIIQVLPALTLQIFLMYQTIDMNETPEER